ncbi:MAG: hypothetical protein AAGF95_03425 [Chloroflexota bacterium]
MTYSCMFDEAVLLDYLTGDASDEVRRSVEESTACLEATQQLATQIGHLLPILYRSQCPDAAQLVAYQEGHLVNTEQLVVYAHVTRCAICQEELDLLNDVDAIAEAPPTDVFRRVVEAIFQPALAMAIRGTILRYQTPEVVINLSTRKGTGKPRTWSVRGELRTHDGQRVSDTLEEASLQQADAEQSDTTTASHGMVETNGRFTFQGIVAGAYRLSLLTHDEEIVIRRLVVGNGNS